MTICCTLQNILPCILSSLIAVETAVLYSGGSCPVSAYGDSCETLLISFYVQFSSLISSLRFCTVQVIFGIFMWNVDVGSSENHKLKSLLRLISIGIQFFSRQSAREQKLSSFDN